MEPLVLGDIQGICIFGYQLPRFRFVFAKIASPEGGQAWLRELMPEITMGRKPGERPPTCLNVAFTHAGLAAMGVGPADLDPFDDAFKAGIENRADILGDTGDSHPGQWTGGLGTPDTHVALMLFGSDESELQSRTERHVQLMERHAVHELSAQEGARFNTDSKYIREHFGFLDGITRVILDGTGAEPGQPLVKPGEFILGHEDQSGATPGTQRLLRNGSYLVYRKIHQDVARWRSWLEECSARLNVDKELVAAKAMGRWPDGTPLVLAPDTETKDKLARDGTDDAVTSDFLYQDRDPAGLGCPFGSHIRRANPRDDPSNAGSKRHLLMRRGLPYGPPLTPGQLTDDGVPRGLVGVFVNASITRQFEHVQRLWLNDPSMRGTTRNAKDPIAGDNDGTFDFVIPARPFAKRLRGLPRFTRVCGGAYLFAPGAEALRTLAKSTSHPPVQEEPPVTPDQPSTVPTSSGGSTDAPPSPPPAAPAESTAPPPAAPPTTATQPATAVSASPPPATAPDTDRVQGFLTTIAKIKEGQVEQLRKVLKMLESRPPADTALAKLGTVHFARWAIIDNETRLLFTSNFDGSLDDYLDDFVRDGGDQLDAVWGNCENYPAPAAKNVEAFKRFVEEVTVENTAVYRGYSETVQEVLAAVRTREKFRGLLDEFQSM